MYFALQIIIRFKLKLVHLLLSLKIIYFEQNINCRRLQQIDALNLEPNIFTRCYHIIQSC